MNDTSRPVGTVERSRLSPHRGDMGRAGRLPFGPSVAVRPDPPSVGGSRKTRGGFYTPDGLVDLVVGHVERLTREGDPGGLSVLEPAAGAGAFVAGAGRALNARVGSVTAVEIVDTEADACARVATEAGIPTKVVNDDFLVWRLGSQRDRFDVAVGNPPFVRSHALSEPTRERIRLLHAGLGLPYSRMTNLWVGVFLGAVSALRPGGVFGFVAPAELITGTAAKSARDWLAGNASDLHVEVLPRGCFHGVLQDVIVIAGKHLPGGDGAVTVTDRTGGLTWAQALRVGMPTWAPCLLSPEETRLVDDAKESLRAVPLGTVAAFEIAALTGANRFFQVDRATVERHELDAWAVPLLQRLRHAPGLVHTPDDRTITEAATRPCYLLDFSPDRPDPMRHAHARKYILSGEHAGLHLRYKTRRRDPWYRTPHIRPGRLILPKNSHLYPRMIVNAARVVTTNSIYRGWPKPGGLSAGGLTAGFHNSLTLLTAEIEGRPTGGGALDLLPSQVRRLAVPTIDGLHARLPVLDRAARTGAGLVSATNDALSELGGVPPGMWTALETVRRRFQQRRIGKA